MNVDATVDFANGWTGLGAIVRNSRREVILAGTWRCSFPDDVEFSEALAIFKGLKMARAVGLHLLVIESNSKNVIDLILGKIKSYKKVSWLVSEIQDMAVAGITYLNLFLESVMLLLTC
ncbi:Ribonuclease H-like domain containing protein [Melia azedarach]|uniref:Ribonuclease H-like domain containing protein n=1 Tax=Melia azedarach TaxID=155640 RepID=A0ACC1WXC5_MELAZ|nr:Ribonuclease H-like domain containing protein [Melia azedarach]